MTVGRLSASRSPKRIGRVCAVAANGNGNKTPKRTDANNLSETPTHRRICGALTGCLLDKPIQNESATKVNLNTREVLRSNAQDSATATKIPDSDLALERPDPLLAR